MLCLSMMPFGAVFAQSGGGETTIDVFPQTGNCEWTVGPDATGLVLSTTNTDWALLLVDITTDDGVSTAEVSIGPEGAHIIQFGDSGLYLAAPIELEVEDVGGMAFAIALVDTVSASGWSSRSWLDAYAQWFNDTFGPMWSENAGAVTHSVLTSVITEETMASTSDGVLLTGTIVVSVPVSIAIVYGGEVALGVGTMTTSSGATVVTGAGMTNAAISRAFFTGQTLVQNPTTISALIWYRQIAENVLVRYTSMGYTGPGVATQTQRIATISAKLAEWGVQ
jgi:hypothetical protein